MDQVINQCRKQLASDQDRKEATGGAIDGNMFYFYVLFVAVAILTAPPLRCALSMTFVLQTKLHLITNIIHTCE
jgi:hypothetical protein